jgi:hypothetical protein
MSFGAGCQAWDPAVEPTEPLSLHAGVPVLVVGSTGDPSTPYPWSEHMTAAVTGSRFTTREGDGHTALYTTFLTGCSGTAITDFLLDPEGADPPATCAD